MVNFRSIRYPIFVSHAEKILQSVLDEREKVNIHGKTTHRTHISKVLAIDEVREILESGELMATRSWLDTYNNLREVDEQELYFDDYQEANMLLNEQDDKRKAMAQILALNESLGGFVQVLASWVEAQDFLSTLVVTHSSRLSDDSSSKDAQEIVKDNLRSGIEGLMPEDLDDATTFVCQIAMQASK